jgi:phenylalanyl-tRNA synthetase beta chain
VHPETRDALGIGRPCFAFELNLEVLPEVASVQLTAVPRFPAIERDVSFFVDESIPAARVRRLVDEARPAILEKLRVLEDYREPGKVPAGKKGMLWSMTYRGEGRTLTDAEVDAAHEALVARLLTALRAERR